MNILYIWEGKNPLPADRAANISIALDRYPEAKFKCITRSKSFFSERFEVVGWDQTKSDMQEFYSLQDTSDRLGSYMTFSDWARFYYLMHNPGTLYMDTDVKLLDPFQFEQHEKLVKPKYEICLLYSPQNGAAKDFLPVLQERIRRQSAYIILWDIDKTAPVDSFSPIGRNHFHHWR